MAPPRDCHSADLDVIFGLYSGTQTKRVEEVAPRLRDTEIQQLLDEPKPLPPDYRELLRLKVVQSHKRADLEVRGKNGSEFRIKLRQAELDALNFSVILAYEWREAGRMFLLRRYNGLGHEHQNKLEGEPPFYGHHIHTATERYQRSGSREEH